METAIPDILLDPDKLNMLLDLICANFVTACYASRENGKKVLFKALQKLCLSVYAPTPELSVNVANAAFQDRMRVFYDELMQEIAQIRLSSAPNSSSSSSLSVSSLSPLSGHDDHVFNSATTSNLSTCVTSSSAMSVSVTKDSLTKDVLKSKLVQVVEEMCRERDKKALALPRLVGQPPLNLPHPFRTASGINSTKPLASQLLTGEIRMEGWLRKRGQHVNIWRDRYFVIRSRPNGTHYLVYFRKKGDRDPRGWFLLGPGTKVDEVRESVSKIESKTLFTFRLSNYTHATSKDVDGGATPAAGASGGGLGEPGTPGRAHAASSDFPSPSDPNPNSASGDAEFDPKESMKRIRARKLRQRAAAAAAAATAATAVVLTGGLAGVGIGIGVGMSAAATAAAAASAGAAGAAGAMIAQSRKGGPVSLAAESLEAAEWWRNSIAECVAQAEEQWDRYLDWYREKDQEQLSDPGTTLSVDGNRHPRAESGPETGATGSSCGNNSSSTTTAGSSAASTSNNNQSAIAPPKTTRQRSGSVGTIPRSIAKNFRTSATFSQETAWCLYDFSSNLRVYMEKPHHFRSASQPTAPPAFRTSLKINASPQKVFEVLLNIDSAFYKSNHIIDRAEKFDQVDDHSDVIYWRLASYVLWPFQIAARELCLLRYWRKEQDDSYFICFQSTSHAKFHNNATKSSTDHQYAADVDPEPGMGEAVRAFMLGGGFIISPRCPYDERYEECWVTLTCQLNPNGWLDTSLGRSWYFTHAYGVHFLEMIANIASTVVNAPSLPGFEPSRESLQIPGVSGVAGSPEQLNEAVEQHQQLLLRFPVMEIFRTDLALADGLPTKFWSEPDATSFVVRGPTYFIDQLKVPSSRQTFRLLGVELFKSLEPLEQIGLSSLVNRQEEPNFIFIINFMLPGPSYHSVIIYLTPEDPNLLVQNTPIAALYKKFFFCDDDSFRRDRLKVIPRLVQGNCALSNCMGTKPAILGTKLYQKYLRQPGFCEIDYEIESSSVASSLVKLMLGMSRDIVIDLAFVIEAQQEHELPECVLGTVRLDQLDLRHATPYNRPKEANKRHH